MTNETPLAALRDPTPAGGVTPPPYYFGVSDGGQDIPGDAFASAGG